MQDIQKNVDNLANILNDPAIDLNEFFDSVYDIQYIIDSKKNFIAVRVMIAYGGPNIYINTWDKRVELFWWDKYATSDLTNLACEIVNNYWNEVYYAMT